MKVSDTKTTYGVQWEYKKANELQRSVNEVLVESDLKESLIRLNSEIGANPELAE